MDGLIDGWINGWFHRWMDGVNSWVSVCVGGGEGVHICVASSGLTWGKVGTNL